MTFQYVPCNLCGADDFDILYNAGMLDNIKESTIKNYTITDHTNSAPPRIVKCRKCGLIYANPQPSVVQIETNYTDMVDNLYLKEEKGRRESARSILHVLKRMNKSGRLLDIGCSAGFLIDEAKNFGWDVYGVDLSYWAVDFAKHKRGLQNVTQGTLTEVRYPDNFFDVVIMKDVIEHLINPKSELKEIYRILKPGGIICVNTPNIASLTSKILKARWWGINQAHLYYFTWHYFAWGSLHKMLNEVGLQPFRTKSHVRVFTFNYWISRFASYNKMIHRVLVFLMERFHLENRLLRINLGDQIEVYGRKRYKNSLDCY
jgi:2-polyprenyl-3-methyl-5-hydroxy-6-metoxy-1,4-benzoquinol methylase